MLIEKIFLFSMWENNNCQIVSVNLFELQGLIQ